MSRPAKALRITLAGALFATVVASAATVSAVNAEAHQGTIKVVKTECVDGNTMKATYRWSWSNVPNNSFGTKVVRKTGTTSFEGNWGGSGGSALVTVSSASGSTDWTVTLNKSQFSGSNGPWEYVYAPWSDGYGGNRYNDTRVEGFDWNSCLAKNASADVKVHAPTCSADGYAEVVDLSHASLVGKLDQSVGTHEAKFKADDGSLFPDGKATKTESYTIKGQLTGDQCITKVEVPAAPEQVDKCNAPGVTDNVAWKDALPASTDQVIWTESADGRTRTASLANTVYLKWTDGTTKAKEFTLKADSGEVCITKVVPVAPKIDKICGPESNDKITLMDQPIGIVGPVDSGWINGVRTLTYSPQDAGFMIPEGKGYTVDEKGNAVFRIVDSHEACGDTPFEDNGDGLRPPAWPLITLAGVATLGAILFFVGLVSRRRREGTS